MSDEATEGGGGELEEGEVLEEGELKEEPEAPQDLALLRALALQSLRSKLPTNTTTTSSEQPASELPTTQVDSQPQSNESHEDVEEGEIREERPGTSFPSFSSIHSDR